MLSAKGVSGAAVPTSWRSIWLSVASATGGERCSTSRPPELSVTSATISHKELTCELFSVVGNTYRLSSRLGGAVALNTKVRWLLRNAEVVVVRTSPALAGVGCSTVGAEKPTC